MPSAPARDATTTIPIVVPTVNDLVGSGPVASYAHPGGNVTGSPVLSPGLTAKCIPRIGYLATELGLNVPARIPPLVTAWVT